MATRTPKQPAKPFSLDYGSVVEEVSKKFKMTGGSMERKSIVESTVPTGMLAVDLILGGGIVGGRWYTSVGGEGAGKTTLKTQIELSAAAHNVPILLDADYEGCFTANTCINVDGEPILFKDLLEKFDVHKAMQGDTPVCVQRSQSQLFVDSYAECNVPAKFKYGGSRRTTTIHLSNGLTFEGAAHPVMASVLGTTEDTLWFGWCMLEQIKQGSYAMVKVGTKLPNGTTVKPNNITYRMIGSLRTISGHDYVAVPITRITKNLQRDVWDVTLTSNAVPLQGSIITNGILTHNSNDPKYCEGMIEFWGGHLKTLEDVFGVIDDKGKVIVPPKVRYMTLDTAEEFFDGAASMLRRLPDKVYVEGKWWYAWDDSKVARQQSKGQHSAVMYSRYKRLMVEAEDGTPQGIFFVDSYPMMFPDKLNEDDSGSGMAAVARAMSANVPKVFSKLRKKNFSIVGVNQLRQKPAVMYGCLHHDSIIHFVDGRKLPIGEVVSKKIQGKVWALDDNNNLVPRKILGWHNNGLIEDNGWLVLRTQGIGTTNGLTALTLTPDHKVMTDKGWLPTKNLIPGKHKAVSKYTSVMNGTLAQFLAGAFSSDCSFYTDKRSINAKFGLYNHQQPEYQAWKRQKLEKHITFLEYKRGEIRSSCSVEWGMIKEQIGNRNPLPLSHYMTPLSLAVIYMDDGNFRADRGVATVSYKRFKDDAAMQAGIVHMWASLGLTVKFWSAGTLSMTPAESNKFFKMIAKYVPECMQYKLPEQFRGQYKDFELKCKPTVETIFADITSVEPAGSRNYHRSRTIAEKTKYDITVEGCENYLAGNVENGIVVHNSPFYEPCGDTLKYASSCRIWLTPRSVPHGKGQVEKERSVLDQGAEDTYRYIHLRTVKNKTFTPYLETWMRIWVDDGSSFAHGFDPVWDTYQFLLETGQLGAGSSLKRGLTLPTLLPDLKKPISWLDFKALILLEGKALKEHCAKLGINTNPKIRERCRKQIDDRSAFTKYFDNIAARASGGKDDDGEEE